ncbi:MAG: hypothetical protein WAK01_16380 [Methylocystis sp.]
MTRGKFALCGALLFGGLLALAPLSGAKAYDDYMTACSKWTGQGAGEQYKCFDCMKTVTDASGVSHWVNTCADDRGGGWSWGPGW